MNATFSCGAAITAHGIAVAFALARPGDTAGRDLPDPHHVFLRDGDHWRLLDMRAVYRDHLVRPPLEMTHNYFTIAHRDRLDAYARDLARIGLETLSRPLPTTPPDAGPPPWWMQD